MMKPEPKAPGGQRKWFPTLGASAWVWLILVSGGVSQAADPFVVAAESGLFPIDTRSLAPPGVPESFTVRKESALFVIDTRTLQAATSTTRESQNFSIDTRQALVGTLGGRVLSGAVPLAGALVELEGTVFSGVTDSQGRFQLVNVLAGRGYVMRVAASGLPGFFQSGIGVQPGANDLGDLDVSAASGPLRLLRLDPDVNPSVSDVEDGGMAYRYYRIADSAGRTAGGKAVQLRIRNGATIAQTDPRAHDWAGRLPGVSDADGLLRVAIPASAVGAQPGNQTTFEILLDGQVAATFTARLKAREYDQVWMHRVGGGVSGIKVAGLQAGASAAFESEVRRHIVGDQAMCESITRRREFEVKAGVEAGAGLTIVAGASAAAGAGFLAAADLHSAFRFNPASTDGAENAMKLYVALGDTMSAAATEFGPFVWIVREAVEPIFLRNNVESLGGDLRLGGYGEAGVTLGFDAGPEARLGAIAEFSAEISGLAGYEKRWGWGSPVEACTQEAAQVWFGEFQAKGSADVLFGGRVGPDKKSMQLGVSLFDFGGEYAFRGSLLTAPDSWAARRIEIEERAVLEAGIPLSSAPWSGYNPLPLQAEARREGTEKLGFDLPNEGMFARLSASAPLWNALRGFGPGTVLRSDQPAALLASVLESSLNDGARLDYERSVYAAMAKNLSLEAELDVFVAGLGVSLEGGIERGAEVVNERGQIWRFKRMALESYPPVSAAQIPTQSIIDLEWQWAVNATSLISDAFHQAVALANDVGETVVEVGTGAANAVLRFGEGAIDAGGQIVTRWARSVLPGTAARVGSEKNGGDDGYLPPRDSSNFVYGVSGVYQFNSTNTLKSAANLTLRYDALDVVGLDEASLRIYQLPDGARHWRLVGGAVDVQSNAVTASVTNLGTFALAPPLPTGDLLLRLGGDRLPADGQTTLTVTISNLVLNIGEPATGPWLFTVNAQGVGVVDGDLRPELSSVQVAATNGTLQFTLRAPLGGASAAVNVASVAGDAFGQADIVLVDDTPPSVPGGLTGVAGQSRISVSWNAAPEGDVAGYRIHYRAGQAGPPWDGTAAVEGQPSPVSVSATNATLRGLNLDVQYYLAVSAMDTSGNESGLSVAMSVLTVPSAPQPPTGVAWSFLTDGRAQVSWTLSEDDGYNDRDVVRYEVWRATMPAGNWAKVADVAAHSGLYLETPPAVNAGEFLRYRVVAVDTASNVSAPAVGSRLMADGRTVDNDGDGMPDTWEVQYGLDPEDPRDVAGDGDADGVSNLDEYLAGTPPSPGATPWFESLSVQSDGSFSLTLIGSAGRTYSVEASSDLVNWTSITNFPGTNIIMRVMDLESTTWPNRYYRAVSPAQ